MNEPQSTDSSDAPEENWIQDKVVLIIGGANESGHTLATDLAEHGAHVALVYQQQALNEAQATKRDVEAQERACLLIPAPLGRTNRQSGWQFAHRVVEAVLGTMGRLDIFIDYSSLVSEGEEKDGNGRFPPLPELGMLMMAMTQIAGSEP
jgi:cation diffusion facilitator CzcD-associated flavoprotein CzcO